MFIVISILGLFFPWLFFEKSVDYAIGWDFVRFYPGILIGMIFSLIFIFYANSSKVLNIITFLSLFLILISCIYAFLSWHVLTVTGEIDLMVSFNTTHYGFYITFISSVISVLLHFVSLKKSL